jgi:GYF domain 2
MLASEQSIESMQFTLVPELSGNPGSNGDRADGHTATSAIQDIKNWFVLLRGQQYGPYTFASLVRAAGRGVFGPEAGVWCVGWAEWRIAGSVPGLFQQEPEPDGVEEAYCNKEHREDKNDRDKSDDRDEATPLRLLASPPISVSMPPREPKRAGHAKGARLAVLCVLAVFVILFGAGWAAISLDIIRVELLPAGAELLKRVEVLLAGTVTER